MVNAAYVYPDGKHALVGTWSAGKMSHAYSSVVFDEAAFLQHCDAFHTATNHRLRFVCAERSCQSTSYSHE